MEPARTSQSRRTSHGDGSSTSRSEDTPHTTSSSSSSSVLFREIHKNGWLKKLPPVEKRIGAFPKKGERVWVVFCVHDDAEPFVELYADQKVAVTHKPDWYVSLTNCLHVSPTICAQEEEYEFVITLTSEVVRLTAASWESMMEWVEIIRSKLREMKILSPRENLYSKMPEARTPLAPTRDPNSPLPAPPAGPSAVVPGVELLHSETSGAMMEGSSSDTPTVTSASTVTEVGNNADSSAVFSESSRQTGNNAAAASSLYIFQNDPPQYTRQRSVLSRDSSSDSPSSHISTPSTSSSEHSESNVTIIEVSADQVPHSAPATDHPAMFNFNFMSESLPPLDVTVNGDGIRDDDVFSQEFNSMYYSPPSIPELSRESDTSTDLATTVTIMPTSSTEGFSNSISENQASAYVFVNSNFDISDLPSTHYERVFLPTSIPQNSEEPFVSISTGTTTRIHNFRESSDSRPGNATVLSNGCNTTTTDRAQNNIRDSDRTNDTDRSQRRRRCSSTSDASPAPCSSSRVATPAERRAVGTAVPERRLQPAPHPYRQGTSAPAGTTEAANSAHLTLREQQVLQLRREMLHPGGVRLQLRRKDCIGSIALIDAFGAVWIAGWKQREHPMLYNALHIGDQLLSTCRIPVRSAADAHKILRAATSLYVEFIIRRVPFGRVYAIRRDSEGQDLGILQEGSTAEIRDIIPGSLAARHGIPPRAQTCDGLSLTNWVITEINGRPLNLFFKEGEVRDRMNAVGREISILVQPFDLVRQLKKQLKALRGYKDYIVQ